MGAHIKPMGHVRQLQKGLLLKAKDDDYVQLTSAMFQHQSINNYVAYRGWLSNFRLNNNDQHLLKRQFDFEE